MIRQKCREMRRQKDHAAFAKRFSAHAMSASKAKFLRCDVMRRDETRRDETRHERQARLSRQEVGAYKLTREGSSKERDRVGSCGYGARKHREEGKARDSRAKDPRWLNKMKCME